MGGALTRLFRAAGHEVIWTDADRLFAVSGRVAAKPAQGS
jgi:hypothetical protein